MSRFVLLALLLLHVEFAEAQAVFSGSVVDTSGKGISGAHVIAHSKAGKTIAYAITDEQGAFQLKHLPGTDHLTVSFLGFESVTLAAGAFSEGQIIRMEEASFKLNEVTVTAGRIREDGDTLSYSVAGFKQVQDRSIADVIDKMPGLQVRPNGTIEYQGKAISNFYIEGMDLMGSQYALASENLSAEKVKTVQVLENHQKIKSLRGVTFSEQAALNIVLKDEAKSIWSGVIDAGAGYGKGWLYDNRLMAMQFGKHFQSLMLYKNNDTGKEIGAEVADIAELTGYQAEPGILRMMALGGAPFERKRFTFNRSHLVAGNWLLKTGKDAELRMQTNGFFDREEQRSINETTWLTIAGKPVVPEEFHVTGRRNEIKGEVNYTLNSDRTYLRSHTRIYADWNVSTGSVTSSARSFDLMTRPWKRVLSEEFTLSHTTGNGHIWKVHSSSGCTWLPGQLLTISGNTQPLDLRSFSTRNNLEWTRRLKRFHLANRLGFDAQTQEIDGNRWTLINPGLASSFNYSRKRHHLNGSLKISYARQSYNEKKSGSLWWEPALRWKWEPTVLSSLSLSYRLSIKPLTGDLLIDKPVFTSYRNQYVGNGEPGARSIHSFTAGYTYRNPVNGLFFNLRPSYVRQKGNLLFEHLLAGPVIVQRATPHTYGSDTYILQGRIAKSFVRARTMIGLEVSASSSEYCHLSDGESVCTNVNQYAAQLDYTFRPLSWMTAEGRSGVTMTRRKRSGSTSERMDDWKHQLHLNFLPARGWIFALHHEAYHSSEKAFGVNFFCDCSISYKASRWELSVIAENLAGISQYERIRISSTLQTHTLTYLRPRSFLVKFNMDL